MLASSDRIQGWVTGYFIGAIYICISSIFFARRNRWLGGAIKKHHFLYALAFGLPLVPHVLSNWVLRASDRFILLKMVSVEALAKYTLVAGLSTGLAMIVNAFGQVWTPRFYSLVGKNGGELKMRAYYYGLIYLIGILTPLSCFILSVVGDWIFGVGYASSWNYFTPLAGAVLFLAIYQFCVGFLFYEKRTYPIALITGLAACINIVLNIYFIPIYGVISAGYTTLASYGFMAIGAYLISARAGRLRLSPLITCLWSAVVIGASHVVVSPVDSWQVWVSSISVIGILGLFGVLLLGLRKHWAVIRVTIAKRNFS